MARRLVIANKVYSSWSMRPWLLMRAFAIPFDEIVIPLDTPGAHAEILRHNPAGKVPVLTDGDLRRGMGPDLLQRRVGDLMNPSPRTIGADALAADALRVMNEGRRPVTSLFVLDPAGRPGGILHVHDLLRAGIA